VPEEKPKAQEMPQRVPSPAPVIEAPVAPAPQPAPVPKPETLPEAYGSKRLVLTARDPRWLYAHWDFTREQLEECNNRSADGHLVLRVYQENSPNTAEIAVHPESRNWFVPVSQPGASYRAELGFYQANSGPWVSVSSSTPATTPPAALSPDTSVEFKTLLPDMPLEELAEFAKLAAEEHIPVKEMIEQLRADRGKGLPGGPGPRRLTPEQEQALSRLVIMDEMRRTGVSSIELEEFLRRQYLQELSAVANAPIEIPSAWSGALGLPTSPAKVKEQPRGFWFNINAEVVIYGATEPNAQVTIGGRPIKLRPDGSFSFRFALPDGEYALPVQATAANGQESRAAALRFSRQTNYQGEVPPHPQSPELKPPLVENVEGT
jgi:hypothetical protein